MIVASPPTPAPAAAATPAASLSPPSPSSIGIHRVIRSWITVVDKTRWTVSHGHVLAHSRTLRTLILRPATPGRHPLVVFCHGYDSTPMAYAHMLTHWASAGFAVAAPYFPLTRAGAGGWLDENDVARQPGDVSVILSAVERRFPSQLDPDHVIVAGHSDGGSTAFAAAFAERVRDRRITAAMVFSGDRWPGLGPFNAPHRRLPMLQVQSDRDESNSLQAAAQVWETAHRPKIYLHLHGAQHLPPFSTACPWRPIVEAVTTDFLRAWTAHTHAQRVALLQALEHDGSQAPLSRVTDIR